MLLNKSELQRHGWTPALIAAILGAPDQVAQKERGYKHWEEHLYLKSRVDAGMLDPRFLAIQQRRQARKQAVEERKAAIPKKYITWTAALPEACAAMFSLNRYAKHRSCSELQRVEIYGLKNELIEVLWRHGYCVLSWIHQLQQPAQECRECDGTGEDCDRCGYTGIWREARNLKFWCFRFQVADKFYCWHQPKHLVTKFAPAESVPPQDWQGIVGEKPVLLQRSRFAEIKELLRWVIDQAQWSGENAQAAVAAEPEIPVSIPLKFGSPVPDRALRASHASAGEQASLFPV